MKLKEKLAEEYTQLDSKYERLITREAYLAGFEKARTMAFLESTRFHDVPPMYISPISLQARLAELGEEEV